MSPFVPWLLLLGQPLFVFEKVEPWKFSEGRQEKIPSLSGTVVNQSGDDWAEARFRVSVACGSGGARSYHVTLRDLQPGPNPVAETAFDAIGKVEACEGRATVEFIDGLKVPQERRPAWVVLGFSFQQAGQPASTELAGILDYRSLSEFQGETHAHHWQDGGARFHVDGRPELMFYALRVEAGTFGLAGFLLSRDTASNPASNFLRYYEIRPNTSAFLGIFTLERNSRGMLSVRMEPGDAVYASFLERDPEFRGRPWQHVRSRKPGNSSTLTRERP
jgi:hypothetical protein